MIGGQPSFIVMADRRPGALANLGDDSIAFFPSRSAVGLLLWKFQDNRQRLRPTSATG
jgi:hypothetical protein